MGRSEDIPCERPLGLSHGLAVSWLGWPGLLGWPGWLAVLAWECVASSHGQAMGSPMRKGCEDGNGGSGSYFTWGGHRTPHVKRLGCLAGWTGRVGWLAWHAGWLPGRAGWPGWLAWQGWLAGRPEGLPTVSPDGFTPLKSLDGRLHYYLCGSA